MNTQARLKNSLEGPHINSVMDGTRRSGVAFSREKIDEKMFNQLSFSPMRNRRA
jgi:hypothetical protein